MEELEQVAEQVGVDEMVNDSDVWARVIEWSEVERWTIWIMPAELDESGWSREIKGDLLSTEEGHNDMKQNVQMKSS